MFDDNTREIGIIEAKYKDKTLGKFVDMHTLRNVLGNVLADKVSCSFYKVNEKKDKKLFWDLIHKGYVTDTQKHR